MGGSQLYDGFFLNKGIIYALIYLEKEGTFDEKAFNFSFNYFNVFNNKWMWK